MLNIAEVEQVINAIDIDEPIGLGVRDRAMLETLYSTGMRRGEIVGLRIDEVRGPRVSELWYCIDTDYSTLELTKNHSR